MKKIKKILKKNNRVYRVTKEIYFCTLRLRDTIERLIYSPFLLLKIDNKKIIASSYFGKGFGDNPGAFIKYLHSKYGEEFKYIWVISDKCFLNQIPEYVQPVRLGSLEYYYHMSTSKIWVDNCRKNRFSKKRKNQKYIQMWHGGISFKKIEKDAVNKLPSYYIHNAKSDSEISDYMISNSVFQTEMIHRAFWFEGEIIKSGSPRLDELFDKSYTQSIKDKLSKKYKLDSTTNIILYAPTFRNSSSLDSYISNFNHIINKVGDNAVLLVRLHPNISEKSSLLDFNENVIDVSDYPNMYDLMSFSDMLITDYSSTMFEFSMLNKPVIIYATDFKEYTRERGSYFLLEELPFPVAKTEEELVNELLNFKSAQYFANVNKFLTSLGVNEKGTASEKIVDTLIRKGDL